MNKTKDFVFEFFDIMKMKKRITPRKGQAPLPSAFFDESKDKVVGDGRKVNNAVRHFIRDDYIRKKVSVALKKTHDSVDSTSFSLFVKFE